jgi:large subunit ribosomal protein L1
VLASFRKNIRSKASRLLVVSRQHNIFRPIAMATPTSALPAAARNMLMSSRLYLRKDVRLAPFLYPLQRQQVRCATNNPQAKGKKDKGKTKKKDKPRDFYQHDLSLIDRYALCDAMR